MGTSTSARLTWSRVGLLVLPVIGLALGFGFLMTGVRPLDADTFWQAGSSDHYYGTTWGVNGSRYVYPPPLAQMLGLIPWPVFLVAWMGLLGLAFWAATREWALPIVIVGIISVAVFGWLAVPANPVLLTGVGNPQIAIAAVCVIGFRYPAAWSFAILTKIAPGIGLLWFLARGEWRNLAIAIGATAAIATGSFILAPGTWVDFVQFASANAGTTSPEPVVPVPFVMRAAMSSALIVWGARTNRRWTVPIGVGWSAIALYEWSYITVWIAALPLLRKPTLPPQPNRGPV